MLVEGLEGAREHSLAAGLVARWVATNRAAWENTGFMYEKYDALVPGEGGGGGEYVPQTGFGWSNGVVLDFLAKYYSR
eukprot:g5940.t1